MVMTWYGFGEDSSKLFLKLEKDRFVQSQISKLVIKEKELTEQIETNNNQRLL